MTQEKEYHVLRRDDGNVVVYYTLDNDPAHYVVYDTLDAPAPAADLARLRAENEAMRAALHNCHIKMMAMANDLNWDGVTQEYVDAMNEIRAILVGGDQ